VGSVDEKQEDISCKCTLKSLPNPEKISFEEKRAIPHLATGTYHALIILSCE
jgi:hypothetical protein